MNFSTPAFAGHKEPEKTGYKVPLHGLSALRILVILAIAVGYASTMNIGTESAEWGRHWGYDPSWYGVQVLFIFSGFLAIRSMTDGRTITDFLKSRTLSIWPALIAATLLVVCVIYPLMCTPDPAARLSVIELSTYFLKTVFLIEPGARLPGLMDDAKYMCLLQGAIWTLRVGIILHLGFLLGWVMRIFRNRKLVLALSILSIAAYVTLVDLSVQNPEFGNLIEPGLPFIRLGYAYLAGIALFQWQDKLRLNRQRILLSSSVIAILTSAFYMWAPWSSVLEILGVTFWLTICLGFLHNAPTFLSRCPRLSPVLYVTIWPAAQVVVALLPNATQINVIHISVVLASFGSAAIFLLLRQARIQPARL
jgi:hypothetical protein